MPHSLAGRVDPILLILAFAVAVVSLASLPSLIYPVNRSQGSRRKIWTLTAACCSGFGIWAAQLIACFATTTTVETTFNLERLFEGLLDAVVLSIPAVAFAAQSQVRIRRAVAPGICIGLAICCSQIEMLGSLRSAAPLRIDHLFLALSFGVMFISAIAALLVESVVWGTRRWVRPCVHIGTGVFLALIVIGVEYSILVNTYVISDFAVLMTHPLGSPAEATVLALISVLLAVAALSGAALDRQAMTESEKAQKLSDLYQRERYVNATLQQAFLPTQLPKIASVEFSSVYLPQSEESRVGGDWYDAFMLDDGCVALSIGDVAGHGLAAALSMVVVRQAIRCAAMDGAEPVDILTRAHRALQSSDYPAIVTAAFATLHPETLELTYTSAGHPPAILVDDANQIHSLHDGGLPLGVYDDMSLKTYEACLDRGGLLVMYTDGCTEFERDIFLGEERLREAILSVHGRSNGARVTFHSYAEEITKYLFAESERRDDAAMLCVAPSRNGADYNPSVRPGKPAASI